MNFRIGIDGGATKTEGILVDAAGAITARELSGGCNPNVAGPEAARAVVAGVIAALRAHAAAQSPAGEITHLHLYAAGNRSYWRETMAALGGSAQVFTADDSHPVLELATDGAPGLVLHGGTGSFVAARAPDGSIHYAGGIGWRFGDPGSGYDVGRRAIGRGLLELQGWLPPSAVGAAVRDHTGLGPAADAGAVTRWYYQHAEANRQVAALAPALLALAGAGEPVAAGLVAASAGELLEIALGVAAQLFPGTAPAGLRVGLSGPILHHPAVQTALRDRAPFPLRPVEGTPIEGVRRLLFRAV
jgi:N-acetylglucosamine kinase-like BadF-type ATPase